MASEVTLEIGIYLHRFHNLDLFQQGWYGLKLTAFWEDVVDDGPGVPSRVVQYLAPEVTGADDIESSVWRINDDESSFHSRPFRIRYARQDIALQEYVSFHMFFDKFETAALPPAILKFELMFAPTDKDQNQNAPPARMTSLAHQLFKILPGAFHGLHSYCPLQFDTFHHVLVDTNVHTVVLCLSYLSSPDPGSKEEDSMDPLTSLSKSFTADKEHRRSVSEAQSSELDRLLVRKVHASRKALLQDLAVFKCICEEGTVEEVLREWPGTIGSLTQLARSWSEAKYSYVLSVTDAEIEKEMERSESHGHASTSSDALPDGEDGDAASAAKGGVRRGDGSLSKLLDDAEEVARDLSSLWNAFLTFHRLHRVRICSYLKRRWDDSQWMDWSMWVVRTELCMQVNDVFGVEGGDWAARYRSPKHTLPRLPQQERALNSAYRAELYRKQLTDSKCKHCPLQDLTIFSIPSANPVLFVERHVASLQPSPNSYEDHGRAETPLHPPLPNDSNPPSCADEVDRPANGESPAGSNGHVAGHMATWSMDGREMEAPVRHKVQRQTLSLIMESGETNSFEPVPRGLKQNGESGGIVDAPGLRPKSKGVTLSDIQLNLVPGKGSGTHVVVFVHGFQGHHLDLRIVRNQWLILDPNIEFLMSEANEDRTFDDFREMGQRLAAEVLNHLTKLFGTVQRPKKQTLGRLSFVGHSIGNIIIRSALTDPILGPYLHYLHTFLSISGPHLGYLYSSNSMFNSGLWILKRFKNSACMHQLTFSDAANFKDCFLFKLSQAKTFELFKHVLLLASPQDRYVPYHSARVEICPASMRDPKRGSTYATMVQGCLSPLIKANAACIKEGSPVEGRILIRCDVNFDTSSQPRSFNNFIGRTAHIEFLEADAYVRFILWAYKDCFV